LHPKIDPGDWSTKEDKMLVDWVNIHGENKWCNAYTQFNNKTKGQVKNRWTKVLRPMLQSKGQDKYSFNMLTDIR